MFVRVKSIRGRRYAYLVEGVREGARVRQRVVCYLGPMSTLALGVPPKAVADKGGRLIDWNVVKEAVARLPLTFEEMSEARRRAYPMVLSARRQGSLTRGVRKRIQGEEDALSMLAASIFRERFVEVGRNRYRMRSTAYD